MKKMRKMMALVLAVMTIMAFSVPSMVFAADDGAKTISITVSRDESYAGSNTADSRNFTWYKVFTASYGDEYKGDINGGGYDEDGTPGAVTGDTEHAVSYTATAAVAAKLGTWDATSKTWTKATGNLWFKLTPIAGSTNYSVTWDNTSSDQDAAQAAAAWLVEKQAYEKSGSLTFDSSDKKWKKDGLDKGYYVISSEAGKNLIAATTDVNVNEKNDYPPLDKTQADEDNTTQSDADRAVAVGDVLDYEVKVTIPKTAKVGDKIVVWDKASTGLTYNNDVEVKTNAANATVSPGTKGSNYDGTGAESSAAWNQLITVTAGSQGKDVVFKFTMTVNSSALTDTDKENESGLKYGTGEGQNPFPYESTPDKVEYKTYFAGIEKVDGQNTTIKLDNVEFTLKEGDAEFKVSKPSGKDYYVYDANGSSTVKTDANGLIKIRGLDNDKTYTLTETKNPHEGYNMLAEPVTLTLMEDTFGTITYTKAVSYDAAAEYYTQNGNDYVKADVADETAFNAGEFYIKTETNDSVYDGTTADTYTDVENNKGTELPSTGGMGTTIFYILGALLVVGCGIVLVSKKRTSEK